MDSRIPKIYLDAEWRSVTPIDRDGSVGIGFELLPPKSQQPVRLRLSFEHLLRLADVLNKCVQDHAKRSHSPMSSGIPSTDVSSMPSTEKV